MNKTILPSCSWLDDDDILYMFSILSEILDTREDDDLGAFHPFDMSVIPKMKEIALRKPSEFEYEEPSEDPLLSDEPKLKWNILNRHTCIPVVRVHFTSNSFLAFQPEHLSNSSEMYSVSGFAKSISPVVIKLWGTKNTALKMKDVDMNMYYGNGQKLGLIDRFKYS